jgi:hypothetical protein
MSCKKNCLYVILAGEITANQDLKLHKTTPYKVYVTVNDGHRSTGPETLTVILTGKVNTKTSMRGNDIKILYYSKCIMFTYI